MGSSEKIGIWCSGHIGVKLQCDLENKTVLVNYVDALLHANI